MTNTAQLTLSDPTLLKNLLFIDNQWQSSETQFDVRNPANGQLITQVANASLAQAQAAIEAAERAFSAWAAKTGKQRAEILRTWFDLILLHTEDLARVLTAEQGKPLA